MQTKSCPVRFEEVKSDAPNQVALRGSFTSGGQELSAIALCPNVVTQFDEMIDSIVDGFYKDWLRKNGEQK